MGVVLAHRAVQSPVPVLDRDMSALRVAADVLNGSVGLVEQPVLDDHGGSVTDETVPLHLSEPETSLPGTSLGGLPGENLDRSPGPDVHLPADHVVQLLVEDDSRVDLGLDHASGPAVVHDLLSVPLESVPEQTVADGILVLAGERGTVDDAALHGTDPSRDHLEHVPDGHTGRDTVGVDHEIGGDSVGCERHVALVDEPSDDSLLSEPGAELVAQLGDPLVPCLLP